MIRTWLACIHLKLNTLLLFAPPGAKIEWITSSDPWCIIITGFCRTQVLFCLVLPSLFTILKEITILRCTFFFTCIPFKVHGLIVCVCVCVCVCSKSIKCCHRSNSVSYSFPIELYFKIYFCRCLWILIAAKHSRSCIPRTPQWRATRSFAFIVHFCHLEIGYFS